MLTARDPRPEVTPAVEYDPFGFPLSEADLADWPPSDPSELAALDRWTEAQEDEARQRYGNDFGE